MIAEIKGKVSSTNSNLTERSEDELTGNFFGNLRYLPFDKGLKHILKSCVYPAGLSTFDDFGAEAWPGDDCVFFWEREAEAEPDVLLVFDETVIIIEVKYLSGLSSDDNIDNSDADNTRERDESCNQLAREGKLLERIAGDKKKVLILLAPEAVAHQIYSDVVERKILSGVQFGYITWQKAFDALQEIAENTSGRCEGAVVDDLIQLLGKKGFAGFRTFNNLPPVTLDVAETWKFDYSASAESSFLVEQNMEIAFSFLIEQTVKRSEYYEFG